ncbi:MAG: SulP family inorganic anion transporter [Chitinophagaceae bacterium]
MNKNILQNVLAGLTVSFAALSLGAAFGIMSTRGAFAGMLSAAIIPIITSIFGGTRIQASGPTAPMTAVSALLIAKAYEAFPDKTMAEQFITLTLILHGVLLIVAGIARLGSLIRFVPNAVVLGFMNGIAFLIWKDQIVKIFGLLGKKMMSGNLMLNILFTVLTVASIFLLPFLYKKINISEKIRPFLSPLLFSIIIMTLLANITSANIQHVDLGTTIDSFQQFYTMLKNYFPSDMLFDTSLLLKAFPMALQLTFLGYLDSLLTALVIDKMTKEKTKQNKELIAQGISNTVAGLLQGIPGAQATIRSVLLVKENATMRLAGILLGVFVLMSLLLFKNYLVLIPSAVFVGVLLKAGWDVSDRDYMFVYFSKKWYKDWNRNFQFFLILLTTLITLFFDLNIAVFTGTALFYLLKYTLKSKKLSDVEQVLEDNID